jgi:hypothetical protein
MAQGKVEVSLKLWWLIRARLKLGKRDGTSRNGLLSLPDKVVSPAQNGLERAIVQHGYQSCH